MKNQEKKFIILIVIVTIILFSCKKFAPGSYPSAEVYSLNASKQDVIDAAHQLKINDVSLNPPANSGLNYFASDPFYHIYFYYPDKNEYIHTWVRDNDGTSAIGFAAIKIGTDDKWLTINNDIKKSDRLNSKTEFISRILNPIKEIISKQ